MTQPIDVVYTWVDDSLPGYLETLRQYAEVAHDLNPNRTRDNIEILKYSLRSLARHAPWVRHVYLVTCRPQVPEWLDPAAPGLSVVHHDQIIDARFLPTFNSFAILSHLHLIEGLSERFLYIEDDMLLGRPVGIEDFVFPDGRIRVFPRLPRTAAPALQHSDTLSPWNSSLAYTNQLLDEAFGPARRSPKHVPLLIDRAVWSAMLARWPEAVERTRASRFRAKYNLVPEYAYAYYLLGTGQGRELSLWRSYRVSFYHALENNPLIALYGRLAMRLLRPKLIALNDGFGDNPDPRIVALTRRFLASRYPLASPFER